MSFLSIFFSGAFFCNCIPHLARGLTGASFPTPFARPRGVGHSSPLVNVIWGALNVFVALLLVSNHPFVIGANLESTLFAAGVLTLGVYLALHFGRLNSAA